MPCVSSPRRRLAAGLCALVPLLAPAAALAGPAGGATQTGVASWHAPDRGEARTASSQPWVHHELVAAHRTLPFGTRVEVTNLHNGRRVVVQITDRGPYGRGRVVDLSLRAAEQLGMVERGTAPVRLEVLGIPVPVVAIP